MHSFGKMEATKSVTSACEETTGLNTGWPKSLCDLTLTVPTQCIRTILTQLMSWRWLSQKTFRMWTVLYWTRSSRTHFCVSINVWRLSGDTLNITCNFLYCNHQVQRDFLITLYISSRRLEILSVLITVKPRYNFTSFIAHTTLNRNYISHVISIYRRKLQWRNGGNFEPTFYHVRCRWLRSRCP